MVKSAIVRQDLYRSLQASANPDKKQWFEKYLRYAVKYRGVTTPQIKQLVVAWHEHHQLAGLTPERQLQLVTPMWQSEYAEDKFAATLYIQLFLLKQLPATKLLDVIDKAFQQQQFYDWSSVDWLCMRVLSAIARRDPAAAKRILSWHKVDYLWQARASLVPFAPPPFMPQYCDQALIACDHLIQREERFAKTAVGWFLRVLSRHEPQLVKDKLAAYENWTTAEVIRNATKYFD